LIRDFRILVPGCLLLVGLVCLIGGSSRAAEGEPNEALLKMIIELVSDSDPDMRTLGLQQVRDDVPGEAVTAKFAALLPDLPVAGQVGLLDALGDRKDPAARPAVLKMLDSSEEPVRAAALRALGPLGGVSDVALLTGKAVSGAESEKDAARQSLIRLRGDEVNGTIVSAMAEAEPGARMVLLDVLAGRNATETLPTVLKSAEDPEAGVSLAALGALRVLADETHTAALVKILKTAADDARRRKAELALLVVCSRGRQACAADIIAGLADADPPSQIVLLHALARAGGAEALEAVATRLKDDNEAVRDEAVRMLSIWGDAAVAPWLLEIAKAAEKPRYRVLAIRGLVRLASPQEDKPADLKTLAEVMKLAKRPQEKRLVLGVLGGVATSESLALVTPALDEAELAEEAGLAAVMIAERIKDGDRDAIRAAMEKVRQCAKNEQTLQGAGNILEGAAKK